MKLSEWVVWSAASAAATATEPNFSFVSNAMSAEVVDKLSGPLNNCE